MAFSTIPHMSVLICLVSDSVKGPPQHSPLSLADFFVPLGLTLESSHIFKILIHCEGHWNIPEVTLIHIHKHQSILKHRYLEVTLTLIHLSSLKHTYK